MKLSVKEALGALESQSNSLSHGQAKYRNSQVVIATSESTSDSQVGAGHLTVLESSRTKILRISEEKAFPTSQEPDHPHSHLAWN